MRWNARRVDGPLAHRKQSVTRCHARRTNLDLPEEVMVISAKRGRSKRQDTEARVTTRDTLPLAPCTLVEGRGRYKGLNFWHVESCPFCGASHSHGAGRTGENPRNYLSSRVAHCKPSPWAEHKEYWLAEVPASTRGTTGASSCNTRKA